MNSVEKIRKELKRRMSERREWTKNHPNHPNAERWEVLNMEDESIVLFIDSIVENK